MSPDKCPSPPPIPTSAHLLLSSVISTSLKSFNLILILCPGKWPPPPPPAQFAPPCSTPSPEVCPSSLCLGTLKTSLHVESCLSKYLPAVFDGSPAAHSRTEFWWGGIFSNILVWGWCLDSYSPFFFFLLPTPIPPASQHNWEAPIAEGTAILHPQTVRNWAIEGR